MRPGMSAINRHAEAQASEKACAWLTLSISVIDRGALRSDGAKSLRASAAERCGAGDEAKARRNAACLVRLG